jgi:hypothetical protein
MSGDEKPFEFNFEEWRKQSGGDAGAKTNATSKGNGADSDSWDEPDMGVRWLRRRSPPALPINVETLASNGATT